MLTQKQIGQIKEHLAQAQNPLFFFDNDSDGLCAFLLLQRYIERGKGVPVKSFPDLTSGYFRKVKELNADYIFILDKPGVSKKFFKEVKQVNIPVIWIDHHEIERKNIPEFVNYYNPIFNNPKTNEPVTALCFQITERKKDLWLAFVGCISDGFVPNFYSDFEKKYPDLAIKSNNAMKIYYRSRIGKIAKLFNFALKDRTTNVINMLKFLTKVKTPYEVLEENSKNYTMHQRFKQINKKYQKLLEKAKQKAFHDSLREKTVSKKNYKEILFFQYGGDLSISADLANELSYMFPDKIVVVAYLTKLKANISIRGKKIRDTILKAIEGLEEATGGGHDDAVGAKIKIEDLEKFRRRLEKLVKE